MFTQGAEAIVGRFLCGDPMNGQLFSTLVAFSSAV
jgi:hypothetical protein